MAVMRQATAYAPVPMLAASFLFLTIKGLESDLGSMRSGLLTELVSMTRAHLSF